MISTLDDPVDEDADDLVARTRREALELLAQTEPSAEELEAQQERRQHIRSAEVDAIIADVQQRQARDYQVRRAPIQDREARQEADLLCRVVDSAPALTARPVSRAPLLSKNPTWAKSREPWARYADALEQVIGEILGKLQKRHASAEERTTSTEARLAQVEARLAALEAKPIIEHEKKPGSD